MLNKLKVGIFPLFFVTFRFYYRIIQKIEIESIAVKHERDKPVSNETRYIE